ncbi:hypothetical protein [Undibacterium sp. Di24W]|uniref:hypothetical protein n=1 Tax=Undibacterium sp. Di24W TaxID=3413033 RepID=UPI003BF0BA57
MTQLPIDRIKDDLRFWAAITEERENHGYPRSYSLNERVQANRSTDTFIPDELPEEVQRLVGHLHSFAPGFVAVITLEYKDKRPQKTKAQLLKLTRERYSQRLAFMHENLAHCMYGGEYA